MRPGTIFISHRAEYGELVRKLKKVIQKTSKGKICVFISEDIPRGVTWRGAIEQQLQDAESLFLLYGAADEDWSWCFYEAGYFAALSSAGGAIRRIYCLVRPDTPPPGPLNNLQIVTDKDNLIDELLSLYARNKIDYDAGEVRESIDDIAKDLFRKLSTFETYPRVQLTINDSDFGKDRLIQPDSMLNADESVMTLLFGIGKPSISWAEMVSAIASVSGQQPIFAKKWVEETAEIILAAHENRVVSPQTVLIAPAGRRFRFLLYRARVEGDGRFCCDFLALDEVGGPALGLPSQMRSLINGIRMGFRFRYELIRKFPNDFEDLSEYDRCARLEEIPRVIENVFVESSTRGDFNLEDLLTAFDENEGNRIRKIVNCWPTVKKELYGSMGLSEDGKKISDNGLLGPNVKRYHASFGALRLINFEFMSRCCACIARMMARSEDQLKQDAVELENIVKALRKVEEFV